jgi:predicted small integral membrane protein
MSTQSADTLAPRARSRHLTRSSSAQERDRSRWLAVCSLPVISAVLVGLNGLYILLVAFGNITDFGTNQAFVQHVLSMDTTNFGAKQGTHLDPDVMWRAITTPWIQDAAYVGVIVWESACAIVLLAGVVCFVRERGTDYHVARALSCSGLAMLLLLFMGGFVAIGGEWFQMWRSTAWNGLDPAFRNSALAFLTLVLLYLPATRATRGATDV